MEEKKDTIMALEVKQSSELATSYDQARAQKEIEGAIVLSKRFPRDEMTMLTRIEKACKRPLFAEKARYVFPRGGATITGPSVNLAREMARLWGNVRYGYEVMRDDDESRKIRAFAWDMESNTTTFSETEFKKLIYRKATGWVVPDERDLRELTNKHAAIAERNCILKLLPPDFIEDAMNQCKETMKGSTVGKSRDEILKKLVKAFDELAITPSMIEGRYGYKVAELTDEDIDELRGIFESIKDGNSTRDEYFGAKRAEKQTGSIGLEDLKPAETVPVPGTNVPEKGTPGASQFADSGNDFTKSTPGIPGQTDGYEFTLKPETAVPWDTLMALDRMAITISDVKGVIQNIGYPTAEDPAKIMSILQKGDLKAVLKKLQTWQKDAAEEDAR